MSNSPTKVRFIEPSFEIHNVTPTMGVDILKTIEWAGRTCYQSHDMTQPESYIRFAETLVRRKHFPVLEFGDIIVKIVCDRGVSHEIVRHRLSSFAQESTRYCNYGKDKFGGGIVVIRPFFFEGEDEKSKLAMTAWGNSMQEANDTYLHLIAPIEQGGLGRTAQEARAVLPNSLKTEIVVKMNIVSWRHFFLMRAAKTAHPQMQEIAYPMLKEFQRLIPVVFDDLNNPINKISSAYRDIQSVAADFDCSFAIDGNTGVQVLDDFRKFVDGITMQYTGMTIEDGLA